MRSPLMSPAERGAVVGNRLLDAARVARIVAGNRLKKERAILDRARHGPAVIERERIRHDAVAAHEPVRRHEPRDAAEGRRTAYRASGVGAQRSGNEAGGQRGARAARGASGEVLEVPRIARGRPRQIERRSAVRELVRQQLAEEDGARVAQSARRRRVFVGNVVDRDLRAAAREYAFGVVDVLERERDAVQRLREQRPAAISASARFASSVARSAVTVMNAFNCGSSASIRCSSASVSSTGESLPLRISDDASAIR